METGLRIVVSGIGIVAGLWMLLDIFSRWMIVYRPEWVTTRPLTTVDVMLRTLQKNTRNRTFLQSLLQAPSLAFGSFAILLPYGRRNLAQYHARRNDRQYSAVIALRPESIVVMISGLAAGIVCALLTNYPEYVWRALLLVLTWFALVAVLLKHVGFVVTTLATSLRRSLLPPFVTFVLVAVGDALALAVLVATIKAQQLGDAVSLSKIVDAGLGLFNVPSNITQVASLTPSEMAVALVGVVYSAALARSLLQPKEFVRTDEDHQVLADLLVEVGDIDQAQGHLEKISDATSRMQITRARIAMVRGRFEEATAAVRRYADVRGEDTSDESAAGTLAAYSMLTMLKDDTRAELVRWWMKGGIHDGMLSALADLELTECDDPAAVATALLVDVSEGGNPLTRAVVVARGPSGPNEAEAILVRMHAADPAGELVRACYRLNMLVLDQDRDWQETASALGDWRNEYPLERLRSLMEGVPRPMRNQVSSLLLIGQALLRLAMQEGARSGIPMDEIPALGEQLGDLAEQLSESGVALHRAKDLADAQVKALLA